MEEDYYQLLQIPLTASPEEINKSYRTLARKYHPDRNPDEESVLTFLKIKKAYDVLTDETQKKEYDAKIRARLLRQQRSHKLKSDLNVREEEYAKRMKQEQEKRQREKEERLRERQEMIQQMEEESRKRKEEEEAKRVKKQPRYDFFEMNGMDDDEFEKMVLDKMRKIKRKKFVPTS